MGEGLGRRLRILHVILNLGETNGQYNEHCLPMIGVRDLTIATYFRPQLNPPEEIGLFAGDGTISGFFRTLRRALDHKAYDVIHVHAPQTGALVTAILLLTLRLPRLRSSLVYTVQDSWYDYPRRNQLAMVAAIAGFKVIVFCSKAAYDSMPAYCKWLVRGRWRVVQNGADFDRVDRELAAHDVQRDPAGFRIVSVGRLESVKDPRTLLEAFASVRDDRSSLVMIGAGSLEGQVRNQAEVLGLGDSVQTTGLIPRDQVFTQCARSDVLVSTSHGEGLPVAVIEAMATTCPVILSDIPPHRELADGADFIPLVPVGDASAFAREIEKMRDRSARERAEIGQRCREHVLARYSLPVMHEGIESVYRSLPSNGAE